MTPLMITNQTLSVPAFLQTVSAALAHLKQQLQRDYEQAYPELREIVHLVLEEDEANAWNLSIFPHLLLPDLVEAHIARLNLGPIESKHEDLVAKDFLILQPAFA